MADATIVGGRGFIGTALARRLTAEGLTVTVIGRGERIPARAGHLYFCAGLTADFRDRLHDTIEAHVTRLSEALQRTAPLSFTYLSSTRVYQRAASGDETATIPVDPLDTADTYNLSKLTGEALCLADPRPEVRVVRLATVAGFGPASPSFLSTLLDQAREGRRISIRAGPDAARDYVALDDAVEALARIRHRARSRLINIAGGRRVTNRELAALLRRHFNAKVGFVRGGVGTIFPEIRIDRMRAELGIEPEPLSKVMARLADGKGPSATLRVAAA